MHWPVILPTVSPETYGTKDWTEYEPGWNFTATWYEMEKLLATGQVQAIGIANSTMNLEKLPRSCKLVSAVNQTEIQYLHVQKKLNSLCTEKGIYETAFGLLGGSGSTTDPIVSDIADRRGCSSGNVLLSWGVKKGGSVIPKSVNPARIVGNLRSCFVMDDQEMAQIDQLVNTIGEKYFNLPEWGQPYFTMMEKMQYESWDIYDICWALFVLFNQKYSLSFETSFPIFFFFFWPVNFYTSEEPIQV
ncbi:hypothetical protein N7508_002903 [Penicillium antarcticum]|uniref:uncharacterized protein n=1 Tax=Penicillium antarcticum TaxID=416450 RepID=UPI0023A67519|nr:uncharacterized protein N7508_002903 [Penicillium antarcticum]KAJ5312073.1 hypothetical protein N7508_002903 [Penicillium antarcticum]